MKHIPPSINRYRTVLPGVDYKLPPSQDKLHPLEIKPEQLVRKLDFNSGKMDRQIVQLVTGFSHFIAKELVERTHLGGQKEYEKKLKKMKEENKTKAFLHSINKNRRNDSHVIPVHYVKEKER